MPGGMFLDDQMPMGADVLEAFDDYYVCEQCGDPMPLVGVMVVACHCPGALRAEAEYQERATALAREHDRLQREAAAKRRAGAR